MKKYLLIFYIFSLAIGQGLKNDVALSPVVTYWKHYQLKKKKLSCFHIWYKYMRHILN